MKQAFLGMPKTCVKCPVELSKRDKLALYIVLVAKRMARNFGRALDHNHMR